MVRTLLFHGNNMGSNPIKDTIYNYLKKYNEIYLKFFWLNNIKQGNVQDCKF